MMLIPIGFLKEFHRFPWANLAIIALCIVVFVVQLFGTEEGVEPDWILSLVLCPSTDFLRPADVGDLSIEDMAELEAFRAHVWTRQPWSLVTTAFLHADFLHLFGNMVFLFVFGCALNGDLGHAKYVAVFLLSAIVSSVGYLLFSDRPMIGASGAICGITGLVAAFYPRHDVRLFWLFVIRWGVLECPALVVIGGWFALDVLSHAFGSSEPVAYLAHITGTLFGFGLGLVALKFGWVESDDNDFLSWYLGVPAGRPKRRRRVKRSRPPTPAFAPVAPSPEYAPLPMAADENDDRQWASEAKAALVETGTLVFEPARADGTDRQPSGPCPAERLKALLALHNSSAPFTDEEALQIVTWYAKYRSESITAELPSKALLTLARLFVRRGEPVLALDAYRRLVEGQAFAQQAMTAVEAAKFAARLGKPSTARRWLKLAFRGTLSQEAQLVAEQLHARLNEA